MELSMYTLLSIAKAHHASDLHITVGVRPKCRISGTLYEMDGFEKLTPAMTKELVESMFGPKQKATMEATGEVDFGRVLYNGCSRYPERVCISERIRTGNNRDSNSVQYGRIFQW